MCEVRDKGSSPSGDGLDPDLDMELGRLPPTVSSSMEAVDGSRDSIRSTTKAVLTETDTETETETKTKRHRHRPGKGLFTLFMILLTLGGIPLAIFKETRKYALLIYLPIYTTACASYVLFLCCVKNRCDDDDDDEMPAVLKEHLECKKRFCRQCRKARKMEKAKKIVQTERTEESGNTASLGLEDSFEDNAQITLAETVSIDDNDRYLPSSPTMHTSGSSSDYDDDDDDPRDQRDVADFFAKTFPGISKTFEEFEINFHVVARKIRRQVVHPPHKCYECTDGAHLDGSGTCIHGTPYNGPVLEIDLDEERNVGANGNLQQIMQAPEPVNLSGKYKLIHNHNFDAFLKSQNISLLLRKAAMASRPIHTYTHIGDTLRVQVDGVIKGDTTYTINGPPGYSTIRHLRFDDHVTWVDDKQAVQVQKICQNPPKNGATQLFITRTLSNDGHNLLIFSKARFQDGSESLECVQTFHRIT